MMQAPAYYSCYYFVFRKLASTQDLLEGSYGLFYPQLWFMFMMSSVVKGEGVVSEHVCSCTDTWDDIATYYSTPLGFSSQWI